MEKNRKGSVLSEAPDNEIKHHALLEIQLGRWDILKLSLDSLGFNKLHKFTGIVAVRRRLLLCTLSLWWCRLHTQLLKNHLTDGANWDL